MQQPGTHERPARAYIETSLILHQALFCFWNAVRHGCSNAQIMISLRLYALILIVAVVLTVAYILLRHKPKTAEDLERERRAWLDRVGRITDGTVIDVQEMPGTRERPSTFLIYQYDVAGVSYEASQDVTYLRQFINLHSCRLGLPTSVRFDPQNPGNSIVVSERWMGLRQ